MSPSSPANLESCVQSLEKSPLFNLSLSSKELFHSNFLAWLCNVFPDQMGALFSRFPKHPCPTFKGAPQREYRNIDLTLEFTNGDRLIIENKVKSIAIRNQLQEYSAQEKSKDKTAFLLLSLVRPSFIGSNGVRLDGTLWNFLSYEGLADLLEQCLDRIVSLDPYKGMLLRDYLDFIRNLHSVATRIAIDWRRGDEAFFSEGDRRLLERIRLHDLMDKIRYGQVAQQVAEAFPAEGIFPIVDKDAFFTGEMGTCIVDSGLTRSEGLVEFKYLIAGGNCPIALGVQLQGRKLKLFVNVPPSKAALAERIARELNNSDGEKMWFDLSKVPSDAPEMPGQGFNQYSGTFLYRYKVLREPTATGIVETFVAYARSIRQSESAIRKRLALVVSQS